MWPIMGMTRGMLLLLLLLMQTLTGWTEILPVRLVNTHSRCSGRVEIFYNNIWGTVCDDLWNLDDAQVVCRQLGCGKALLAPSDASFGEGIRQIWLDNVQCRGNESSLAECAHRGFGSHNCFHEEDASVICEEIPTVRLVNSDNSCSGRVEIFYNNTWGTVCDDAWDLVDAQVVCRQLGCGKALLAPYDAYFGQGRRQIWLDEVQCRGNELSLAECAHLGFGSHNCDHDKDASVICEEIPTVRLVNSDNSCSGRVEILQHGHWGTVCHDSWDLNDAHVVCQQVGCGKALAAPRSAHFGRGTGLIWLDDLQCSGNETSLTDCAHRGLLSHDCYHSNDASVICEGILPIRLVNSSNSCSGRVEILQYNHWGTVCDDDWDINDARVVCQQLGCGKALAAPHRAHFGQGTGPIWLDDFQCSGNETSLTDCAHRGLGSHNCDHSKDASVICEGILPVRLVNSIDSCSGRVEIHQHGIWGTVCDDYWDIHDAQVVCQQLGCGDATRALHRAHFGPGTGPIWLDEVQCRGSETSLTDCSHNGVSYQKCRHHEDASVICEEIPTVRLVDSDNSCSGRVEILQHGHWGTICDDSWDLNDAHVVCQQLGCGKALAAPRRARFGQGTGRIWLDDFQCSGNETSLTDCAHRGLGSHNCDHSKDASVICEGIPTVRLVDSDNSCSGRVEILQHGHWGTVCDDSWDLNDAHVVCHQMGCGKALAAPRRAHFGQGTGPIWLDDFQCSGNETTLTDCAHRGLGSHNCDHSKDASVICEGILPIRLVNSYSRCSGRVEFLYNNTWGTVCDHLWDLDDAQVVCRQMGCGKAVAAPVRAYFGWGSGQIWLDYVQCRGNESSLAECEHLGFGAHYCFHGVDASVICEEILPVRLENNFSRCSGRLEIFYNNTWGTVCDDDWNLDDAQVVCRQLSCGKALLAPSNTYFGEGSGQIWLDEVQCRGNELSLEQCAHLAFGNHDCGHGEDASVICEGITTTAPPTTTPTTTIPTTTGQPLLQDSQLVCSPDQIEVGVPLHSLLSAGLNASSGHLASPYCSSHAVRGSIIWYKVQWRTGICGTVMMTNTTHAIYSNSLFFYPFSNGSSILPSIIPFSCAYPLETHTRLNATIKPQLQKGGLVGSGTKAKAYMDLYRDSNFSYIYPAGQLTLSVGSMLHVQVSVNLSDPSFAVVLEECYTTNSSNPDDPIRYFLIHSRCPTDSRRVSVVENGMSLRARFSALLFPLHGGDPCVFIHCRLRLCDKRSQNCVPTCRRRITRSVDSSSEVLLSVGPINLV